MPTKVTDFRTERVDSIDELKQLIPAWEMLAQNAIEANINYEPIPLISLLENLDYPGWFVLLVWQENELRGFFPMQGVTHLPLPIEQFSTLFRNHFMSCMPLVHKDHTIDCLSTYWNWFSNQGKGSVYHVSEILDSSELGCAMIETAKGVAGVIDVSEQIDRSVGDVSTGTYEDYLANAMSSKSRATMRRKLRKVCEKGEWSVRYATHNDGNIESYMDLLSEVEAKSWKQESGTAIEMHPGLLRFMKDTASHAAESNRMVLAIAFVDEKAVAGMYGLVNGQKLLIYKIGYDAQWREFSVGQLAMLDVIDHAIQNENITSVDSCAAPDADMFNRCLPDRENITKYRISSKHLLPSLAISGIAKSRDIRLRFAKAG